MLKKMMLRKIAVATSILLVMLMLYLIPGNKNEINMNQILEYIYPNDLEAIYLLDNNDLLSRIQISVNKMDSVTKARDLIESLTINGKRQDILPNGFKSLLPIGTKILNIDLKDKILTVDFSSEFLNIKEDYEEKLIESITYTLTEIDGIDKIIVLVNGKRLTSLPNSKKKLPEYLDRSYGINKQYQLTTLKDIDSYTVYYVLNYNDKIYYTPVTKYINNENQDKVKIIIDELSTSLTYQTNLMSYLDANVRLLDYEIVDKTIKLNFNDLILSDITNNVILEEVIYTIGLSLCDELDVNKVIFQVNNQEISTFSPKGLEKN